MKYLGFGLLFGVCSFTLSLYAAKQLICSVIVSHSEWLHQFFIVEAYDEVFNILCVINVAAPCFGQLAVKARFNSFMMLLHERFSLSEYVLKA